MLNTELSTFAAILLDGHGQKLTNWTFALSVCNNYCSSFHWGFVCNMLCVVTRESPHVACARGQETDGTGGQRLTFLFQEN